MAYAGIDLHSRHTPLLVSGGIIAAVGVTLATLIALNWDVCVRATSASGAAQAVTGAVLVCLIGIALLYSGMAKTQRQS